MAGGDDKGRPAQPKRKRGRPRKSSPEREKVIAVAMLWIEQGYSVHKAVRIVIDVLDAFGDVSIDAPPLLPGGTGLVRKSSYKLRDQAAIDIWNRGSGDPERPPPWPDSTLHPRDVAVEHIAATIRRRMRAAKSNG